MGWQRYTVEHETRYAYRVPVAQSWQLAHLTPRLLPWQRVRRAHAADRAAARRAPRRARRLRQRRHALRLHAAHSAARGVDVLDGRGRRASGGIGRWRTGVGGGARCACGAIRSAAISPPARMSEPTRLVPWSDAAARYAAPSFRARAATGSRRSCDLMHRIHADFEFEPGATTVSDLDRRGARQRSGVCQDFAHLMIGCLRRQGLRRATCRATSSPTRRPDGPACSARMPRMPGSRPTAPAHGWVEFDPTNDRLADQRYITLAWGARLRRRGAAARRDARRARPAHERRGERDSRLMRR